MMFQDQGLLDGFDLLEAIIEASEDGTSGTLVVEGGLTERLRFAFRDMKLVGIDVPSRLSPGAVLVRAGKLAQSALDGLSVGPEEDRFAVAVRSGVVTAREEQWARKMTAIEALAEVISWGAGTYTFAAEDERLPIVIDLPITRWVLELVLRSRDRAAVAERLGPMDSPLERTEKFTTFGSLGLTADADAIVALIDGRRSTADILRKAHSDEFAVMKLLAAMRILGLARTVIEAPEPDPIPLPIPLPPEPSAVIEPEPESGKALSGPFEVPIPPEPAPPREIPLPLFALTVPEPAEAVTDPEPVSAAPEVVPQARPGRSRWPGVAIVLAILGAGALLLLPRRTAAPPPAQPHRSARPPIAESGNSPVPVKPTGKPEVRPTAAEGDGGKGAIFALADRGDRQFKSPGRFRYSIQLELACEEATVARALRADPEKRFIWIATREFRGRSCYRVLWGRFREIGEARAARDRLPGLFRQGGNRPVIVGLGPESKSRR